MYWTTKSCQNCGRLFTPKRKHGLYCKESCRIASYKKRHNIPIPNFAFYTLQPIPSPLDLKKQELTSSILEYGTLLGKLEREAKQDLIDEQRYQTVINEKQQYEDYKSGKLKWEGFGYARMVHDSTVQRAEEITLKAIERLKPMRVKKMELVNKIEKLQKELDEVEHNLFINKNKTTNKLSDAASIAQEVFDSIQFTGKWKELLGKPERGFTAVVYGKKFSGKSTFALEFADYLTNFGTVIYFSVEEGMKMTLQNKLKLLGISNPKLKLSAEQLPEAIMKMSKQFDFAIIDSLTTANITADDLRNAKLTGAKTSYIGINHVTTEGIAKGGTGQLHNPDIIIQIQPIGKPIVEKNRYEMKRNTPV